MERDVYLMYEDIYLNTSDSFESDNEYTIMNEKNLSKKTSKTDIFCCNYLFECLSSCCFFLCV
jgi:hypothetical protein